MAARSQVPEIMKQSGHAPWLYLAPALLIMLFFVVYPTVNTIYLSFLDTEGAQSAAVTCPSKFTSAGRVFTTVARPQASYT